jgi:hypothetical protein
MSFTNVAIGFNEGRYSFEGPDFGYLDVDATSHTEVAFRIHSCPSCGLRDLEALYVACADYEFITAASNDDPANSATLSGVDRDAGDATGDEEDDEADDEAQDDDTESERA